MSSDQKPTSTHRAAEELLASLAGIVSAHVVPSPDGRFAEIHVLCTPDLHPKQVVRNVESALSAGLGIEIDRRVVSVAQIRSDLAGNGHSNGNDERDGSDPALADLLDIGTPAGHRIEFVRYQARRDAERCTCDVTLRDDARDVSGSGSAADTSSGRAEAAALAVFEALGKVRPGLRLALDGAVISSSRGRSFVIIAAHALLDRDIIPLAGAAALSRSPEEAAILAALQATNRWSA